MAKLHRVEPERVNEPMGAREALLIEAIGEMATLIDSVDRLIPELREASREIGRAMVDATRVAFDADLGAMLQRLQSLQNRPAHRWEPWLTHVAAAATASAATWALAITLWVR